MYWGWGGGYYRRLFCVSRKSVQSVQYVTHIFQFSCEQFFSELVADITEFGNAVNIKVADSEGEEAEHSGSRSRSSGKNMTPLLNIDVEITGEKGAAADGVSVQGAGIKLPCKCFVYGPKKSKSTLKSQLRQGK